MSERYPMDFRLARSQPPPDDLALATFGNPLFRSEESEDNDPAVGAAL